MAAKDRPFAVLAAQMAFGPEGVARINNGECPRCGTSLKGMNFRNKVSEDEAAISGLCQRCQDDTFRPDEDESA